MPLIGTFSGDLSPLIDDFALNLHSAASAALPHGNTLVSPVSVLYATLLLYLGSKGSTRFNLYTSLHLNKSLIPEDSGPITAASVFGDFLIQLKTSSSVSKKPSSDRGESYRWTLAYGIFIHNWLEVNQKFASKVARKLRSAVRSQNFFNEPESSRNDINQWAERLTGGKVRDVVPRGSLTMETISVLVSAAYFKARWKDAFDDYYTKSDSFFTLDGQETTARFMRSFGKRYNYTEDKRLDIQYVEIPFEKNDTSLLVYLPKRKTGLQYLEKALSAKNIRDLAASVKPTRVDVTFPRFRIDAGHDLKEALRKMGVQRVFTAKANLREIVPDGDLVVSEAVHKSFISLDENGVGMDSKNNENALPRIGDLDKKDPIPVVADRPFLFAIRHNPTRAILLFGRVENP